jgi:GNAT superfamily N-acetyltransferase
VVPPVGTGSAIETREALRTDRDSFLEVIVGSYGPFEHLIGLDAQGMDEIAAVFRPFVWAVLRLLKWFGRPPVRILVAAESGQIVGSTILIPAQSYGYIVGVATRPSHRRQGIAGHLVERAEELTRKGGRRWAVLDVEAENAPARALYQARGYETIQTAVWLRSADPRGITASRSSREQPRVVGRAARSAVAEGCRRQIPPAFAAIVPPAARYLTHLERLVQLPGVAQRTWAVGPSGAPLACLSAYWRNSRSPGVLFFPVADPRSSAEPFTALAQSGIAWLREKGSPYFVAAVPDTASAVLPVLEELGFRPALTTLTMGLPLRSTGRRSTSVGLEPVRDSP